MAPGKPALSPTKKPTGALAISSDRLSQKADLAVRDPDNPRGTQINTESNLFNKHYNKELKLCEGKLESKELTGYLDEIPMVLCELNESALAYL